MRRLTFCAVSALFSLPVVGQNLLECVDPDVLNGLIFNARSEAAVVVTPELPDRLSAYRAPEDFELIGTAVRGGGLLTTVAFKTRLDNEEAFTALLESFEAEGWALEPHSAMPQTFNVTSEPRFGNVCRDGERLSLSVQDADDVRYAHINLYGDRAPCGLERQRLAQGPGLFESPGVQMPALDFPPDTRPAGLGDGPRAARAGISSGDTLTSSTRVESTASAAMLAEHFSPQLIAQGWALDAAWKGSSSSGSTWTRRGGDDQPYWGTLEIITVANELHDVTFMLMTRGR